MSAAKPAFSASGNGHLAENITYFARALRAAGMPVGPGAVLEAVACVEAAAIGGREDFYWTLHSVLVKRRDHSILFDHAFRIFWRKRDLIAKMMQQMLPPAPPNPSDKREKALRRIADALFHDAPKEQRPREPDTEFDSTLTMSDAEILKSKDFEQMTAAEIADAKTLIAKLALPLDRMKIRRLRPLPHGRLIDPRRTLRASMRAGGAAIDLKFRGHEEKHPPLVALCDISGSMSNYSRLFLHFLHALSKSGRTVHSFLFATELTNVTRMLRGHKDPDIALEACGRSARDWDGGTRIGQALETFNKRWGRRVLGQGAVVLMISDGLERQAGGDLTKELDRLHRSCRRLIWLNPLLRYEGFEAKAAGIRAMLPHVDEFRTLHNLDSMSHLCEALSAKPARDAAPARWLRAA